MVRFIFWIVPAFGWCISAYDIVPIVYATSPFDGVLTGCAFSLAVMSCLGHAIGEPDA